MRVAYRTLEQIRSVALQARRILEVTDSTINMLDILENGLRQKGIHYHIVEAQEIPGDAARAMPEKGLILVAIEAYDAIHDGDPAQQLLVPHELAHFALGHVRTFARSVSREPHIALEDSEVQADLFSHEFTMPVVMVRRLCQSVEQIQGVFNVPIEDARIRRDVLREERLIEW